MAAADPRTDVSRCSSCRRWAGPPVGAEKCKQRVGSLDPHALMMLQLSHTPHSSLCRMSHAALMCPPAFTPLLSLRPRFFFHSTPASLRFCRPVAVCSRFRRSGRKTTAANRHLGRPACALSPVQRPSWEPVGPPGGHPHSHTLC